MGAFMTPCMQKIMDILQDTFQFETDEIVTMSISYATGYPDFERISMHWSKTKEAPEEEPE